MTKVSLECDEWYRAFYSLPNNEHESTIEIPQEMYERLSAAQTAFHEVLAEIEIFIENNRDKIEIGKPYPITEE